MALYQIMSQSFNYFRENIESGLEKGGAFAAYYQGELVVSVHGGYADLEAEWKWSTDTLCQLFSSTKAVTAVVMAMLVDRYVTSFQNMVFSTIPRTRCWTGGSTFTIMSIKC